MEETMRTNQGTQLVKLHALRDFLDDNADRLVANQQAVSRVVMGGSHSVRLSDCPTV